MAEHSDHDWMEHAVKHPGCTHPEGEGGRGVALQVREPAPQQPRDREADRTREGVQEGKPPPADQPRRSPCSSTRAVASSLVLLDVEDGTSLHEIKTECGITVSPVAPAELIVYVSDSQCKVVFDAVYGSAPGRDARGRREEWLGCFPLPPLEPDLKVQADPGSPTRPKCDDVDVVEPKLALWMDGCPICGKLTNEDVDEFE